MQRIITLLALLVCGATFAQTMDVHNEGRLYISPGTLLVVGQDFVNEDEGWLSNDGELLLGANYKNNGLVDFIQDGGITRFEGDQFQMLQGDMPSDFYNILFDNPSQQPAFGLANDFYVFGEVSFTQGIVDNKNYNGNMIFQPGTAHFNTSDQSYVEGYVIKKGKESFKYPVGEAGHYRPAVTVLGAKEETSFSTKYFLENSNPVFPHNRLSVDIITMDKAEYWKIETTKQNDEVLIRLTYDPATTPADLLEDPSKLGIVAWNIAENRWNSLGGVVNESTHEVTSVLSPRDYVAFTLATIRKPDKKDLIIYNAVNPGDIGGNEYFKIVGLNKYPNNYVQIFNRWGVRVFQTRSYDTHDNVFRGISHGRITIAEGEELPVGTYFYVVKYQDEKTKEMKSVAGYLYLTR